MRRYLTFWKALFRKPILTGAVIPSSRELCHQMLKDLDLEQASCVVELGPGTGAFTKEICQRLNKNATFLCIEVNPIMSNFLKKEFPDIQVITDYAENLKNHMSPLNVKADYIISGLPLTNFPISNIETIIQTVAETLRPSGKFITFQYFHSAIQAKGKKILKKLENTFHRVQRKKVAKNIPPAYVISCEKKPS